MQQKTMDSLLYALGLIILFQHAHGNMFNKHLDELRTSLLDPINEIRQKIEANLEELQTRRLELEEDKKELALKLENAPEECKNENLLRHAELHSSWDVESCLNLTGDWRDGILVGLNLTMYGMKIGSLIWDSTKKVMDCSEKNFFKEIPCYYSGGKELFEEIEDLKDNLLPLISEAKDILKNMKQDFNECVRVPKTLKDKIDRNIQVC